MFNVDPFHGRMYMINNMFVPLSLFVVYVIRFINLYRRVLSLYNFYMSNMASLSRPYRTIAPSPNSQSIQISLIIHLSYNQPTRTIPLNSKPRVLCAIILLLLLKKNIKWKVELYSYTLIHIFVHGIRTWQFNLYSYQLFCFVIVFYWC